MVGGRASEGNGKSGSLFNVAIAEINEKTDLQIALESLGRSKHRRVTTLTFRGYTREDVLLVCKEYFLVG
jgi:hypothetical protein